MSRALVPLVFAALMAAHVLTAGPRPCDAQGRMPDTVLDSDLAWSALGDVPAGGYFRHNGKVYVRLVPDPPGLRDGEATDRAAEPLLDATREDPRLKVRRVIVARLTGPDAGGVLTLPATAQVRKCAVRLDVTRAKEAWE